MNPPRHLAFFLTAHGFGHGVRQSAFIHALPPEVKVTLFTDLPEGFFHEELHRPFTYIPLTLDCGCIQPDNIRVDIDATLNRYRHLHENREALISQGVESLNRSGADFVIGDAPPLAFPIAKKAGIPSWAIFNFSWSDIYRPYLSNRSDFQPIWHTMQADYQMADQHIRLTPFMGEPVCPSVTEVGMLTRPGQSSREQLARRLKIDPAKRWCLIYLGNYGLAGIAWERLEAYQDWEFLGLYDCGNASNYTRIQKDPTLRYADLTASADLVLGKLGYGLVTECAAMGTPVVYLGRQDFCEFEALEAFLEERGLGKRISLADLMALNLEPYLSHPRVEWAYQNRQFHAATGATQLLEMFGWG